MRIDTTRAWREMQLASSLTEIEDVVKRNYIEMMLYAHWSSQHIYIMDAKLKEFEITDLYTDSKSCVSNSHHAPRGKKTNWGGWNEDLPRGYPGVSGLVTWKMEGMVYDRGLTEFCLSRALGPFGIHTGTGGGHGNGRHQYSVEIFFEDFPRLNKKVQQYQRLIKQAQFKAKLANKPVDKSLIDMII